MKLCIVAATEMELKYLKTFSFATPHSIEFYTHGVGMLLASYNLQKIASTKPDFIVQCGIAGTYSNSIAIGKTVVVYSECLGDTGAEDHEKFIDIVELGFLQKDTFPFSNGLLVNESAININGLKTVKGMTVNLTAGNEQTIKLRTAKFHPDIETMEGACLHYVCLQEKIPFMQFRGISNRVEPRDKSKWELHEALKNCHEEVIKFIHQL